MRIDQAGNQYVPSPYDASRWLKPPIRLCIGQYRGDLAIRDGDRVLLIDGELSFTGHAPSGFNQDVAVLHRVRVSVRVGGLRRLDGAVYLSPASSGRWVAAGTRQGENAPSMRPIVVEFETRITL